MSKRPPNPLDRRWREAQALAAKPGSPGRDAKLRDALEAFVAWSLGSSWQLTSPTPNGDAAPAIVLKHGGRELWTELSSAGETYSCGLPRDASARGRLEDRIRTIIETLAGAWLGSGWRVMPKPRSAGRPRTRRLRDLCLTADGARVMTYLGAPLESRTGAYGGKPKGLRSPPRVDEVVDRSTGQPRIIEAPPEPVRRRLGESDDAYRKRLCSVVAAAGEWAQLWKPDGQLPPPRPPSKAQIRDFVNTLLLPASTDDVTVLRSEIAYFLLGHRWRLSREGVRSALRDGRPDTLSR